MDNRCEKALSGTFNGRHVDYVFALELVPVRDEAGSQLGTCSVSSYVADARGSRPVLFLFNGGPGAASAFLHLSGIGPKRAVIPDDLGQGIRPPYELADSPGSVLDVTDLVFVDPVNAGFGRALPDADTDSLYSLEGDARYFADILTSWVARHDRWDSPKYVLGESYGTIRAPFLATALLGLRSMPLDGLVLLGQALNVQETLTRPGNVSGAIADLPLKVATAWYHGVGARQYARVEDAVTAAVEFAHGEYATALLTGDSDDRKAVAERLADLTGVSAETYLTHRLWHRVEDFRTDLLADREQLVGTFDSRYVGTTADRTAGEPEGEPSTTHLLPAFTAAISRTFHGELGVPFDVEYRLIDPAAGASWDWRAPGPDNPTRTGKPSPFHTYPYVARLTHYLKQVPHARVFIGTGLYDTLTTVGAVEHLLRQYDLPRDRVTSRWYPAGHMMYTDSTSLDRLTTDLRTFVQG